MTDRTVLSELDILRALKRIAHEILEANSGPDNLLIVGIPTRGAPLAERICKILKEIEPAHSFESGVLDITLYRDDQSATSRQLGHTSIPVSGVHDKTVVLVDDVLFSGRTIRAALDALTEFGRPRQVKLAVLVDRGHRELPIRPDFVGKNLPTAISEHVAVNLVEIDGVDQVAISE